ncbi:hypothetical protein BC832DRAFT_87516 [Gaertneriomyces semiglobifer]|nr:hypothetical protein BC832DRAFT_87516 [Gaertneriomyces semiglobifer]
MRYILVACKAYYSQVNLDPLYLTHSSRILLPCSHAPLCSGEKMAPPTSSPSTHIWNRALCISRHQRPTNHGSVTAHVYCVGWYRASASLTSISRSAALLPKPALFTTPALLPKPALFTTPVLLPSPALFVSPVLFTTPAFFGSEITKRGRTDEYH